MIRVLFRHAEEAEARLVGDFPPGQIDALESLIRATEIYDGNEDPVRPGEVDRQLVLADPPSISRWCLELIWSSP